ncbi:hypothetical protein [Methylocystis parvus]|uniref:hypothetical protein n=1 Tax=Methylocystis parvus TaxID=134 RepID=UPI003C727DA2
MELGQAMRRLGMAVVVARPAAEQGSQNMALVSGRCYSACVYALMGGKKRVIPPQSRVGIHRMFNYRRAALSASGKLRAMLARYARASASSAPPDAT